MFGASEFTVSSPPEALFVISKLPLFGYVYVPSYEDNVKSPETATPSYVISTSPFSLSSVSYTHLTLPTNSRV